MYYTVFAGDVHVGSVHLRRQANGPSVPPLTPLHADDVEKDVDLVVIGYVYKKQYWGVGYATEAGRALLDAYGASVADEKALGKKVFYVEGETSGENLASVGVLRKLGFQEVGWEKEDGDNQKARAGTVYHGMYV
jgi:RimJ/RimL family protein N-acetyltransferase